MDHKAKDSISNNQTPIAQDSLNDEWVGFFPPDRAYSVELPRTPYKLDDNYQKIPIKLYISGSKDARTIYSIREVIVPDEYEITDAKLLLKVLSLEMWSNDESEVVSKKYDKFLKFDSLKYELRSPGINKKILSVWTGKVLYDLTVQDEDSKFEGFDRVVNSFHIY